MKTQIRPLSELNHEAMRLLFERIGMADTMRFINQFRPGQGNYTADRDSLFGHLTLDNILGAIEQGNFLRPSPQAPGEASESAPIETCGRHGLPVDSVYGCEKCFEEARAAVNYPIP